MQDLALAGKRVLIREDLNVPIRDGEISSDARIRAALPTVQRALDEGATVRLLSHLGRPVEGEHDQALSLAPVASRLSTLLGRPVPLITNWIRGTDEPADATIALYENVRFNQGEKANDDRLARKIAALCDVYVMDAFGAAHRAHASTHGVAKFAPIACAGPLLAQELEALSRAFDEPAQPVVAIVGGAKVSTKFSVLSSLCQRVDHLILGGGIANTFLAAAGFEVGRSLMESEFVEQARRLMDASVNQGAEIPLPDDVVTAAALMENATPINKLISAVSADDMILDIGPQTQAAYGRRLNTAGTIIWNGPVGVFEIDQFGHGTRALAQAVAASPAFSIAGGGDTLAAIEKYDVADQISYISTGGGAFLEFLQGAPLPAVAILEERYIRG